MSTLGVALMSLICSFGGAVGGVLIRERLPGHHFTQDTAEVVKLGTGLIGTMAALVLGLLVASAATEFNAEATGLQTLATNFVLLDRALRNFGPEAEPARERLSVVVERTIHLATERGAVPLAAAKAAPVATTASALFGAIRDLEPHTNAQKMIQNQCVQTCVDLARAALGADPGSRQSDSDTLSRSPHVLVDGAVPGLRPSVAAQRHSPGSSVRMCALGRGGATHHPRPEPAVRWHDPGVDRSDSRRTGRAQELNSLASQLKVDFLSRMFAAGALVCENSFSSDLQAHSTGSNDLMRFRSKRVIERLSLAGGIASLLLAIAAIGLAAQAPPAKDQSKPATTKDGASRQAEPKKDQPKLGLLINDPRAFQGYTLISPFDSSKTFLFDMQGRIVNTWETGCTPALSGFLLENGHLLRPGSIGGEVRVFGPGPAAGGRIQEFTWEGSLVWDFKFYNAKQLPHHNMTRLPNGNVLLIVWDRKIAEEAIAAGRRPEMTGDRHFLPDSLIEIKPTGKTTGQVVWEWHLWDHLVQDFDKTKANFGNVAEHPELVNINYGEDELPSATAKDAADKPKTDGPATAKDGANKPKTDGAATAKDATDKPKTDGPPAANRPFFINPDFTHFNGVDYNPDLDQIAVSVWNFSEFWIIDHSTTTAEAAAHSGGRRGKGGDLLYRWGNPRAYRAGTKADRKLFRQHNAHWIPQGLPGAGTSAALQQRSRAARWELFVGRRAGAPRRFTRRIHSRAGRGLRPAQTVWSYTAPKKSDFYSSFISGAQRLSNGNTLICSGANGTIFEVTPNKAIVWKYVNPVQDRARLGSPPRPGQIVPPITAEMLGISSDQQKQLDEIQKDIDAHLDKLLTAEQKKQAGELPGDAGGIGYFPSPTPGQVMAPAEQNRLKLTEDQKKDVIALQKAVDGRFDQVLSAAQKHQIKSVFAPFVPPPRGPGPADIQQPGKIFSTKQQGTLNLSAAQRKRLEEIQKEIDAKLETLFTEDQKRRLQTMQVRPAGGGPGGNGPPGGPPLFRRPSICKKLPRFRRQESDTWKIPGRNAAQRTAKEGSCKEGLRARIPARGRRIPKPSAVKPASRGVCCPFTDATSGTWRKFLAMSRVRKTDGPLLCGGRLTQTHHHGSRSC